MRKMLCFARRNRKEMLRDPLSLFFGIIFPIILLLLLTVIDRSLPAEAQMDLFHAEKLAPGIAVFSLSFIALFAAMLISKDRGSSFLLRLYTSPLTGRARSRRSHRALRGGAGAWVAFYGQYYLGDCSQSADCGGKYCPRDALRHTPERKGGRRHLRRAADKSVRVAVGNLVFS